MKKFLLSTTLFLSALAFYACGDSNRYKAEMVEAIEMTGENGVELSKAYQSVPKEQREAMAFLIAYMPQDDRDTLTADFLIEEVKWAYKARETFPWVKTLPDSIFYNDVLPYASMDETREHWREVLWNKFYPLIEGTTDMREALKILNSNIGQVVGVEYNTKRRRANQSPSESMEIGMASCSGLSILLTDVLRTFGIPARIAGTPLWVSKEGNHNWVEVWMDGKWAFTEYGGGDTLNKGWLLDRAGKADKTQPIHWIYATSWKPTGVPFVLAWNKESTKVAGVDVTDFYIDLYNAQKAEAQAGTPVVIRMFADEKGERSSADRVAVDIRIKDTDGNMVAAGKTAGPTNDMNDYLTLYLPENNEFGIEYIGADGPKTQSVSIGTERVEVELYMK